MPLTPNFSVSQTAGDDATINVTDTSTGSDVTIVTRRLSFLTNSGTYLVPTGNVDPQWVSWALIDTTKSVSILNKNYALTVTVDWLDVSNAVVETKSLLICTSQSLEELAFNLLEQESEPTYVSYDNDYLMNALALRMNIDNANRAVDTWGNISVAQNCLDRGQAMLVNQAKLF